MTQPTNGFPDFQSYPIWRGTIFLANVTQGISSGAPVNVSGLVTHFASLAINVNGGTAGGVTATVKWFTDSTLAQQTAVQTWVMPAGVQLGVIVPCLGNFVTIQLTTPTAAVTTTSVAIFPTNTPVSAPSYVWENAQMGQLGLSIAASQTMILKLPQMVSGRGHYYFVDTANSTKLSAHVVTLDTNANQLTKLVSAYASFSVAQGDFTCNGEPLGVLINNGDAAAAHSIDFALMVDGRV